MSQVQRPCWHCDACGYEWMVRFEETGKAIEPERCINVKCRKRGWNRLLGKNGVPIAAKIALTGAQWKTWREKHHMSQAELAKLTGVSERTVQYIEAGDWNPKMTTQAKFRALMARKAGEK